MNNKKEVSSPCISVCSLEEDIGYCRGCLRSLEEIAQWKGYNETTRKHIMAELDKRRILYSSLLGSPYST